MNKITAIVGSMLFLFLATCFYAGAEEPDAAGCSDHPLFTRMQDMRLVLCKTVKFDSFKFKTGKGTETVVEGKRFDIKYQTMAGSEYPGPLAIIRNHQQAITKIGGTVLFEDSRYTWLKIEKDGKEIWAQVDTAWMKGYMLTIIEKQAMAQEVTASAELFKSGLSASGHVEIPGIFFDSGKSVLKPESEAAVAEIATLLKADPGLKVYVVGHTDNVGGVDSNVKLSQDRAEAILQALVRGHGIDSSRLRAHGCGQFAPVASNDTEDGRARNRRVELVKQ
ncbi:MAG: OmpA family protein [Desulfobacteraceae bacterium]|nr:MAG: OmpA family protein [Desulfobacteraceae bacterium]